MCIKYDTNMVDVSQIIEAYIEVYNIKGKKSNLPKKVDCFGNIRIMKVVPLVVQLCASHD